MKKTTILWIILDLIFIIIFNALFFAIGGIGHNVSAWVSYGFIHFAYLLLLLTPVMIRRGKSASVFGFSLFSISAVYFLAELVIGIIFIVVSPEGYIAALSVQLCIAGVYGVMLVSNMLANEHTAEAEEIRQNQIDYIKMASAELKGLLDSISDKDIKKKVERVYDTLYSSPVKSHPNLAQMEAQLLLSIGELANAVSSGNDDMIISLADSLLVAVNKRNNQLKTLN